MSDIYDLLSQMQHPQFYPHTVAAKIEMIQTHAAYVFLTGKYAYKIKKNVNYGFLDYSSLEKRKYFLDLELSLNQKITPELYLAVIPISNCHNNLILDNSESIQEYALKMHQFPQENLFSNLLASGKLTCDRLIELGKVVAQFHQQTTTNTYIQSFGTVAKISAAIRENYQQSQQYIGVVQTKEQFVATQAYTDAFFTQRKDLFVDRVKQQKIRECHGDLHLKNICLWHDEIKLFDRIEFNESFRYVDTMYDVTRSSPSSSGRYLRCHSRFNC